MTTERSHERRRIEPPSRESNYLNNSWLPLTGSVTRKRVPPFGRALDVDPAVVRVDDLADDRQPQAGALRLGREERAEDPVHHVRRHARARRR